MKKITGRVIFDKKPQSAYVNMATDYAIMSLCETPTLRLYSWSPSAVSIGRFQSLKDEVDTEFCDENGINYVRRITGGGAVFHQHELTYSFCIPTKNEFFSPDLHESYRFISQAVIDGLSKLGINAEYKPINDLQVGNRKISGCAQTRKNNVILQHGTILMDLDVVTMFRILKVPKEKISDKQIADVKERVTSIKDQIKKEVSVEEAAKAIIEGFNKVFKIDFKDSILTPEENKIKEKAEKEIFSNPQWTYER